ncbi:hypothetical protein ACFL47_11245, partial [Candidatus Latescibacterota bacterium]
MKRWIMVAALLLVPTMPVQAEWNLDEFLITMWGTPEVENLDAKAKALADADFNVVVWQGDKLDILKKHGLKGLVHVTDADDAKGIADHPALWAYHLGDEPYPESMFPPLAEKKKALHRLDPHHPAFINMLSTTGVFLRAYMEIVEPELLSYDYYQWKWGSDRYYEKLEEFREAALEADIPLAVCIGTTANPRYGLGPSDNAEKLRQSVYTNLAYGVKGVEWFHSRDMFKKNSTELNKNGEGIAVLNKEMKTIGPVLVKLRSIGVYHTAPLFKGTREAPTEHWVHLIGEEDTGGLVLGMFVDDSETNHLDDVDVDYMMVTNRDYRNSQNVVVRFQSKWLGTAPWHRKKREKRTVECLNKTTGEWEQISGSAAVGFIFFIQPGDG